MAQLETFVWGDDFITGVESVDQQHHGLVALFNELSEALMTGQDLDAGDAYLVFQRLLNYAEYHFKEEDELMRQCGLDPRHIAGHDELHRTFVDQLRGMWVAKDTMSHPAEIFLSFLTSWLGLHILGSTSRWPGRWSGCTMVKTPHLPTRPRRIQKTAVPKP